MAEQYQDVWINGNLHKKGIRECESRYKIIKEFAKNFDRPITVLDIGANSGYFSVRLAEDFDCTSVMIEGAGVYADELADIAKQNNSKLIVLKKFLDIKSIKQLASSEHFDIVLAMSVIHHIPGDSLEVFNEICKLGDYLIMEFPVENTACGQHHMPSINKIPSGEIIGYGKSHLKDGKKRPIHLYNNTETSDPTLNYIYGDEKCSVKYNRDFKHKTVIKSESNKYEFIPGITLWTYLVMNGIMPNHHDIITKIKDTDLSECVDIRPWNIIIDGQNIHPIDLHHVQDPDHDYDEEISNIINVINNNFDINYKGSNKILKRFKNDD